MVGKGCMKKKRGGGIYQKTERCVRACVCVCVCVCERERERETCTKWYEWKS